MLANILMLTVLTVVSSRYVPYNDNVDIEALIGNIYRPGSNFGASAYDVMKYDSFAEIPMNTPRIPYYGRATMEPMGQFMDQFVNQRFPYYRRSNNEHVTDENAEKTRTIHDDGETPEATSGRSEKSPTEHVGDRVKREGCPSGRVRLGKVCVEVD